MYYPDLTPYDYGMTEHPNALNIGWLEEGKPFTTGDFPEKAQLLEKLKTWPIENKYRGWHSCEFCDPYERKIDSTGEMGTFIVPDRNGNGEYIAKYNGKVYAAPTLVAHYIAAHNYLPPKEFIEAILNS